jgi:uncharacterized protein
MIRVHGIKLNAGEPTSSLLPVLCRKLRIPEASVRRWVVARESLDAREKPKIFRVFSLDIAESSISEEELLNKAKRAGLSGAKIFEDTYQLASATRAFTLPPVVCGFGPCGIFAALVLARLGLKPIVLERGAPMAQRIKSVEEFWSTGKLDPITNVQFGEGGAGTFSDGKLTTGTADPAYRFILSEFVAAGAPEDILYKQKPHIGTDLLRKVVVNIRRTIEDLGGQVRFFSRVTSLEYEGASISGVWVNGADFIPADTVILALGHSARDSFSMLHAQGLAMEQKQFSMGVRIEHLQESIDRSQYGAPGKSLQLPPAEYKLSVRTGEGRGVYTFCMCPGGYVVASASEPGGLVTNGMSNRNRNGKNANAALLVDVYPSDFPTAHPLAGVEFQKKYEALAFQAGGGNYKAPAQLLGDFIRQQATRTDHDGPVDPSYRPGITWTDLDSCLPAFVSKSIREALPKLGRKLSGFDCPGAVLTGIESRSSSPVRILRNKKGEAISSSEVYIKGLYPGGEGAGYAGGIMSAAADGVHLAESAARRRD